MVRRQFSDNFPNHFRIIPRNTRRRGGMSERGRGRGGGRRSDGRRDGSWTWGLVSKTVATGPGGDLESNFGQMRGPEAGPGEAMKSHEMECYTYTQIDR